MTNMIISPMQQDDVTRGEFGEFKGEMRNFRLSMNDFREDMYSFKAEMYLFRDKTEKRFDKIDRQITELREEIPRYMGMLREGFRDDLKASLEFLHLKTDGNLNK